MESWKRTAHSYSFGPEELQEILLDEESGEKLRETKDLKIPVCSTYFPTKLKILSEHLNILNVEWILEVNALDNF
jgi:hypothetical protein